MHLKPIENTLDINKKHFEQEEINKQYKKISFYLDHYIMLHLLLFFHYKLNYHIRKLY